MQLPPSPMADRPRLIDAQALALHRARAGFGIEGARFLHDAARFELQERLQEVNRTFTKPVIITAFPQIWADFIPGARLVPPDEVLALAPGAQDLVIHALALHWAEDPVGQVVQAARALAPDGLFLAVAFGDETLTELRQALAEAEIAVLGGLSPRVAPMAEIRDMGALLQRAGLALPVADHLRQTVEYDDALALMRDLRAMGETNALAARHRAIPPRALFAQAAAIYAQRFPGQEKSIQATFDLVFLTGWSPHTSQQQPLRPGSAQARLADALNSDEFDDGEFDDGANPVQDRRKDKGKPR